MKNLRILIDMDGVIVDTIGNFNKRLKEMFPEIPIIPYKKITEFYLDKIYPKEYHRRIEAVWQSEGLFYGLEPIPGAIEAIEEIRKTAKDVAICTSPQKKSKYCAQEKWEWVRDNLNSDWLDRVIIAKDKTRIYGDILIDDKPLIKGRRIPKWEQILYTHPWNKDTTHLKRLTWNNWRDVLKNY